eukprot:152956-Hanusia_phi.AAC.1
MVDMTLDAIQQITKELKQYQTPSLNDKLYLHFKGWKKIEPCINEYDGVKALWLEGNALSKIENFDKLVNLRCLYIQQNCLEDLSGLENCPDLDAINCSNNSIRKISHISHLHRLNTLQISNNKLTDATDVEHLRTCPSIGVLDLQNNRIEDPAVLDVLAGMPNLRVLQMQGNPVTRKIAHYRKTVIARCSNLTYLDDRPVFEDERRTTTAWARGGAAQKLVGEDGSKLELTAALLQEALQDGTFDKSAAHEAEKEERAAIRAEKEEKERRNREAFQEMMLDARVRRIQQILPHVRLFKELAPDMLEELSYKVAANPVHKNEIVGFAKDEVVLQEGEKLEGLYILLKGRVQFCKDGKPCFGGVRLATGQYFGEVKYPLLLFLFLFYFPPLSSLLSPLSSLLLSPLSDVLASVLLVISASNP